jgi:FAD dependent oxidoreductase TIGR03364
MSQTFDAAVVGAGVLGLAHAYHLARRGMRVIVFERNPRACGASIRNFGMLWPIGQPAGAMRQMALCSREFWLDVLPRAGIWHERTGSLHLAYQDDEAQVLREFVERAAGAAELITPSHVAERSPAVKTAGLKAAIWSPSETCVDPRQVIAELPAWLNREYGVQFAFDTAVSAYHRPVITAGGNTFNANHLIICTGDDFQSLFPEAYAGAGLLRCKLQMMRSQSYAGRLKLGPMLAGGLTLRHYKNFQDCPTLASVKERVARENPQYDQYGIHVMASQNGQGELILGDSHEYDDAIQPFDKPRIDQLILDYLHTFLEVPDLQIAARWHGTYAKHPTESYLVKQPAPGATCVTAVGGAGMTLSFGLADQVAGQLAG